MKFQLAAVTATLLAMASAMPAEDKNLVKRQEDACCVQFPGEKSVCERECWNPSWCKPYGIPQTGYWCDCDFVGNTCD